jgi:ABC-2 type transport system permease protein
MAYVESAARAAVDQGEYVAAILIPADFTANLSYTPGSTNLKGTAVNVYADQGRPISAGIIRSIADSITKQLATGSITIQATFTELQTQYGPAALAEAAGSLDLETVFACAFTPVSNTIRLDKKAVTDASESSTASIVLVSVGSAQALFFALFTAQFGVLSMYNERRDWTLQRLIMSPTPRSIILGGKLIGVFISVIFQLVMLFLALTAVGSIIQGKLTLIWGSDGLRIALVLISAALAVSGLGMLMAGIVKSPEQAQTFNYMLNIALAVLGGAFGFSLPEGIARLSLVYWGRNAFDMLAAGQGDIWLHVIVLAAHGVVLFGIGIVLFNRHFEST